MDTAKEHAIIRHEINSLRRKFDEVNSKLLELYRLEQLLFDNPLEYQKKINHEGLRNVINPTDT